MYMCETEEDVATPLPYFASEVYTIFCPAIGVQYTKRQDSLEHALVYSGYRIDYSSVP